ncbi:hypothetical protein GLAREA_11155 [Glarea lozoyensis ATCC 20868]|uniref:Uncharacterized protein n=1 Tax=Glarea lozoyensis (strain ATCC 20868 / MF5171) TaxID=1116229 RepID=S3DU31_GLAL2|nr:uncharacterized protein GLAREA_11155 [Glarea lozoyensis ATCC 20868]EPE35456.1 hypothetical protein GLAREA_11155 [Glarea lozoyensis ATCC 20868]
MALASVVLPATVQATSGGAGWSISQTERKGNHEFDAAAKVRRIDEARNKG